MAMKKYNYEIEIGGGIQVECQGGRHCVLEEAAGLTGDQDHDLEDDHQDDLEDDDDDNSDRRRW